MSKNLVIVESPGKIETIEKFLGKDFKVMSSKGHIRDIEGIGKNSIGIDFQHDYQPNYVIDQTKHQLIQSLEKEVEKADMVWLASDEDREGEAIAWHLKEVLNLKPEKTRRIVFHEITSTAIQEAIQHPRDIDYNMVNAQQARRVLDRIVGFELSPVLWRKVSTGLSAGRVQSVAVRLIVERERELEQFVAKEQYAVYADFQATDAQGQQVTLKTKLSTLFPSKEEAVACLEKCKDALFTITSIQTKPTHRSPASPFTTSLLQQEAAKRLRFTVSKTMRLAQALYEAGKITYMRTDSTTLSSLAIATTREVVLKDYGERYYHSHQYHTSAKGAQEAHEAIRPTYISEETAGTNQDERKLYELIRRRTLASQMADAEIETTRIEVSAEGLPYTFVAQGEVVVFDGYMRAYTQNEEDKTEDAATLPQLSEHTPMHILEFNARQTFSTPPAARYNEATLVHELEKREIGRPSTYATIIETIQTRHYVERGNVPGYKREYNVVTLKNGKFTDRMRSENIGQESQKLLPTDLGRITNDFLVAQFPDILSYDFTAKEEDTFDAIAAGRANWVETVDQFYQTFHPAIQQVPSGKVAGRLLGTDPESGEPVYAKVSKIGPCIQIGDAEKDKPKFVSLKKGQSLFTITLEEALALMDASKPHAIAVIDGEEVIYGEGKYGPYLRFKGNFISLGKDVQVDSLTEEDVRTMLARQEEARQPLRTLGDIQVMQGRFGLYLKAQDGNYRLPKTIDIATLTHEACQQIIDKAKATENSKNYKKK